MTKARKQHASSCPSLNPGASFKRCMENFATSFQALHDITGNSKFQALATLCSHLPADAEKTQKETLFNRHTQSDNLNLFFSLNPSSQPTEDKYLDQFFVNKLL